MKNLNDEAKRNNLVFINEVGLDPGIDHFSHLLVKKLKETGLRHLDVTYHSYCGGFPAIPNDFKYKFSWSPVGVIKALNNDAKFINNFQTVVKTPYKNIGKYSVNDEIYEAYPNQDSTPYIKEYNFDQQWNLKEFVRGTLRLNGWENAWKDILKCFPINLQILIQKSIISVKNYGKSIPIHQVKKIALYYMSIY